MRLPNAGRRLGRLIITTCQQGTTRNLIDQATTVDAEGNSYRSVAIVRPWRRRRGEYPAQRALVIGWRRASPGIVGSAPPEVWTPPSHGRVLP